jgi:hypothetical protein
VLLRASAEGHNCQHAPELYPQETGFDPPGVEEDHEVFDIGRENGIAVLNRRREVTIRDIAGLRPTQKLTNASRVRAV